MGGIHGSVSQDLRELIVHGQTAARAMHGFGERTGLTTVAGGNDIWNGASVVIPIPASAGEQMSIVSTSVQDVDIIGTGARTVDIEYLDADGVLRQVIVALNGTVPVNLPVADVRFVQSMHVQSWGANLFALGTITIFRTGFPAIVYSQIDAAGNMGISSARMVPAGKNFFMDSYIACAGGSDAVSVRLRSTSTIEGELAGSFLFKTSQSLFNSAVSMNNLRIPLIFPPLAIIKATAYSATAGSRASFNWSGWFEPE